MWPIKSVFVCFSIFAFGNKLNTSCSMFGVHCVTMYITHFIKFLAKWNCIRFPLSSHDFFFQFQTQIPTHNYLSCWCFWQRERECLWPWADQCQYSAMIRFSDRYSVSNHWHLHNNKKVNIHTRFFILFQCCHPPIWFS